MTNPKPFLKSGDDRLRREAVAQRRPLNRTLLVLEHPCFPPRFAYERMQEKHLAHHGRSQR